MGDKYQLPTISTMTAIMSLHNEATTSRGSFTTGQSWGALRKAWKGYRIAKVQGDNAKKGIPSSRTVRLIPVSSEAFTTRNF